MVDQVVDSVVVDLAVLPEVVNLGVNLVVVDAEVVEVTVVVGREEVDKEVVEMVEVREVVDSVE